jgi:hypothetical protein
MNLGHPIRLPDHRRLEAYLFGRSFRGGLTPGLLNHFLAFAPRLATALLPKDSRREATDIPSTQNL